MNQTATVEVLTAEVRVLMVGSRQITMGVFTQLDEVYEDDIEAFGRVRPRNSQDFIWVVGKHKDDGTLARSCAWRALGDASFDEKELSIAREWAALPLIVLASLR
jgi:hypothetical protein